MNIKKCFELLSKEFQIEYVNSEGEEDDYRITFQYIDGKWYARLKDDYTEDEMVLFGLLLKEINKEDIKPMVFDLEKKKFEGSKK